MPERQIDPARLEGEALRRWYLRSPDEIERERQANQAQRYQDFFDGLRSAEPDPGFGRGPFSIPERDPDPGFAQKLDPSRIDPDPGFSWVPVGANRWRGEGGAQQDLSGVRSEYDDAFLDRGLAGPDDGGEFIEIDSKARRQRKHWEQREGRAWPTVPETGRNFDRSHVIPKADGGPDTVDNIRPQHPDDHRREHMERGDFKRWGARSRGGPGAAAEVPTPKGAPKIRGLGPLFLLPDLLGVLNGRIRSDSFSHFVNDLMGYTSPDDLDRLAEDTCRSMGITTPGAKCV